MWKRKHVGTRRLCCLSITRAGRTSTTQPGKPRTLRRLYLRRRTPLRLTSCGCSHLILYLFDHSLCLSYRGRWTFGAIALGSGGGRSSDSTSHLTYAAADERLRG